MEQPGQFCCDDGTCIDSQLVCNNFPDCRDRSDEERNCSILILPPIGNTKDLPPVEVRNGAIIPLTINTTFNLSDIFDLNEVDCRFDIRFKLHFKWFDKNIQFRFLKSENYENVIPRSYSTLIWTPEIIFEELRDNMNSKNERRTLFVTRSGTPILLEDDTEVYDGNENSLNLVLKNRMTFLCPFGIENYPFGNQECSFQFYLDGSDNRLTDFHLHDLYNEGPKTSGQFIVNSWRMESKSDQAGDKMVRITVSLRRKMISIFMVIYLPTILMNLINQATNYIVGDTKYDLVYTINITCMMVLSSVYLSVAWSLPGTANIKPVEVWLIFNLAYPLTIILVNVILQVHSLTN